MPGPWAVAASTANNIQNGPQVVMGLDRVTTAHETPEFTNEVLTKMLNYPVVDSSTGPYYFFRCSGDRI